MGSYFIMAINAKYIYGKTILIAYFFHYWWQKLITHFIKCSTRIEGMDWVILSRFRAFNGFKTGKNSEDIYKIVMSVSACLIRQLLFKLLIQKNLYVFKFFKLLCYKKTIFLTESPEFINIIRRCYKFIIQKTFKFKSRFINC